MMLKDTLVIYILLFSIDVKLYCKLENNAKRFKENTMRYLQKKELLKNEYK